MTGSDERRAVRLTVCVSRREADAVEDTARSLDTTMSRFIRRAVLAQLERRRATAPSGALA